MAETVRAVGVFKLAKDIPVGGFVSDPEDDVAVYLRISNMEAYDLDTGGRIMFTRVGDGSLEAISPVKTLLYYPASEVVLK